MATLVLTAVGSAIGGPLGGAIGAALGRQADNILFAPKARQGPRLKELEVQTSSYGTQIPAVFGVMRVAGTVIWATDLVERRTKSGGGKGRPSTVNYSYSVSMAVALSSRPVARIGRIWADGNLLRGAAGDLKVDTQLRLYTGHDDQPLDPLMASAEGAGHCPAYRGIAYAIFEDLQLAEYGNRIPSLTFELFEREDAVPVTEIFEHASGGAVGGTATQTLRGFALAGASAREPLVHLADILSLDCVRQDRDLHIRDRQAAVAVRTDIVPVLSENSAEFELPQQTIEPLGRIPQAMTLRYYDPERDFQISLQRGVRGVSSRGEEVIEFPAVLDATEAKRIVEQRLCHMQSGRFAWSGDVVSGGIRVSPGVSFADAAGQVWHIDEVEHRFGTARITAHVEPGASSPTEPSAIPGRHVATPDVRTGQTRLAAIELPSLGLNDPGRPLVALFASGTDTGWRRAALSLNAAGNQIELGITAQPAIMGTTLDPLTPHPVHLIDARSGFSVRMFNSNMDIANRTGSPLDPDAPLVWLAGEFIRYGNCVDLGGGMYRFSNLLRGCHGQDEPVPPHPAGSIFVLVEPESARIIDERLFASGDVVKAEALGLGDSHPVTSSVAVRALATTPLAPVHGTFVRTPDGGISARWIRRSRIDNGWKDGVDQIIAEDTERYRVRLFADTALVGEWEMAVPTFALNAVELPVPASSGLTVEIVQIGRFAESRPLQLGPV